MQSLKWNLTQLSYVHWDPKMYWVTPIVDDISWSTDLTQLMTNWADTSEASRHQRTSEYPHSTNEKDNLSRPDRNARENNATGKTVSLPYDLPTFVVQDVPSPVSCNKFKSHSHRHGIWTKSYDMNKHMSGTELTVQNTPIQSVTRGPWEKAPSRPRHVQHQTTQLPSVPILNTDSDTQPRNHSSRRCNLTDARDDSQQVKHKEACAQTGRLLQPSRSEQFLHEGRTELVYLETWRSLKINQTCNSIHQ